MQDGHVGRDAQAGLCVGADAHAGDAAADQDPRDAAAPAERPVARRLRELRRRREGDVATIPRRGVVWAVSARRLDPCKVKPMNATSKTLELIVPII